MNSNRRFELFTSIICVVICASLIGGCQSTEDSVDEAACQTEQQQNCGSDDEAERGYDPCLVNKNLPVCNT